MAQSITMKTITNIVVFDNDPFFLALLKGYCYANAITMTALDFTREGINEAEKRQPVLIIIPLDWINTVAKPFEIELLMQIIASHAIKLCTLVKNPMDVISAGLTECGDIVITNPFDIDEFDAYIKKTFLLNMAASEEKTQRERRSFSERRRLAVKAGDTGNASDFQQESAKDFQLDNRSKCLFLNGYKVYLTPKEFKLFELLSTDIERVYTADEIINYLWPENNRATKSDLYQYMHLLRKKIEQDPNNPQWIMNVKGFGYKLNTHQKKESKMALNLAKDLIKSYQETDRKSVVTRKGCDMAVNA
jgi:DNA-binding response OmpR family regulator